MRVENAHASPHLAGAVRRYHTWPTITTQTVAEHCWRVASIYVEIFGLPRAEVLYYILHHDSGELWCGDIPNLSKKYNPGMREAANEGEKVGLDKLGIEIPTLSEAEWFRFKLCDLLEGWEHSMHERHLGNRYAQTVIDHMLAEVDRRTNEDRQLMRMVDRWVDTTWKRFNPEVKVDTIRCKMVGSGV